MSFSGRQLQPFVTFYAHGIDELFNRMIVIIDFIDSFSFYDINHNFSKKQIYNFWS